MRTFIFSTLLFSSQFISAQSTWYNVVSGTNSTLRSIDFPSESVGYVAGDNGVILKSIDGGRTWDSIPYAGIQVSFGSPFFTDIDFVDELNGFVVLANSSPGVYITSDGGMNWTSDETTSNMCYKRCVYPLSMDDWYLGGAGCFQSAMIDHQTTAGWTFGNMNYESFNPSEYITQMDFEGNLGLAAMNGPYIFRTTDAGASWDTISTGITGVHTSVHFVNTQIAYAGYDDNGGGFGILVSMDGGLTWEQDLNSATFFYPAYLSVTSAFNGDVYAGARPSGWPTDGLIFELAGGGWNYYSVDHPINDMTTYGVDVAFGVGDSGLIVVNVPPLQLGIEALSNELETLIYPNPTQDFTTIKCGANFQGTLELFDLNGRKQQVDINFQDDFARINLRLLPTGTYVLRCVDLDESRSYLIQKQN